MDSDPRAFSSMFAPTLQNPMQKQQSYLVDGDSTSNGRSKPPSRSKVNGRTRSATNPEPATPQSAASPAAASPTPTPTPPASGSPALTRTVSTPTTSTTATTATAAKPQSKPRRGLFSLLASAASQPPTPPKPDPSANNTANVILSAAKDASSSNSPAADPPQPAPAPSFMQSIARRLSGSSSRNKSTEFKNQVPQCPRRTLNINRVRPRPEIKELERLQLRRVCFVMDETLVSKRLFKASEPFETDLPRENRLKVRDLKEAYHRSAKNREVPPDERVSKVFAAAHGVELGKLDLSKIKFANKEAVLPVCDVLSLINGLDEVVLEYCELTDEQLRLFLCALMSLRPRPDTPQDWHRGISKISIAGNTTFGMNGWRSLALFVHLNPDLVCLNISHIPISLEAAQLLSRAIALPNPCRREIPPEFRLRPVILRPKSRKFSFRRASATGFGTELARVISPTSPTKHGQQPSVSEEIEVIEGKPGETAEGENKSETQEPAAPATPAMHTSESSSIVVVDPPACESKLSIDSRAIPMPTCFRVGHLRMNDCGVTTDILRLFVAAVKEGGVRYWDIGNNKFGLDGMRLLATLFTEIKPEDPRLELGVPPESGRVTPSPVPSISPSQVSGLSLVSEEKAPPPPPPKSNLEFLSLRGTDLSSGQLQPILDIWFNNTDPETLPLWALELSNCKLGGDLTSLTNIFKALSQNTHFRLLHLQHNPLFSNPDSIKVLREWLPRLSLIRRISLASTGMTARDLVEFARILPKVKTLATLDLNDNPIYDIYDDEEEREGQTEDVSGLTALDAAMRYCPQIIEVELPEGGGDEVARLRSKLFLRCFKNIEFLDHAVHPHASEDPSEYTLGGRKRTTTEEAKELALQPTTSKESRDKYEVDRGHGVARALETVLLNASSEDKAQDMSLDLLHRARKIKERLQPALARSNQDEITLRRLTFLNHVLSKVIDRFEEAFPECSSAPPKPKPSHEPDSSDEEDGAEDNTGSPPSPTTLRRSSSMSELARGLELEEGDVHRFNQFVKKRGLHKVETLADLSSEQLLEAILSVDKETVEREVWDKAGLQKVLRRSIDEGQGKTLTEALLASKHIESVEALQKSVEEMDFSNKLEKKDSDSRSI